MDDTWEFNAAITMVRAVSELRRLTGELDRLTGREIRREDAEVIAVYLEDLADELIERTGMAKPA
jgi:hypothetical protein